MKIFVLLPRIPWPLEKGDKLRAFNQIKQLAKNNEVVLCALNTDRKANKKEMVKDIEQIFKSLEFDLVEPEIELKNRFPKENYDRVFGRRY